MDRPTAGRARSDPPAPPRVGLALLLAAVCAGPAAAQPGGPGGGVMTLPSLRLSLPPAVRYMNGLAPSPVQLKHPGPPPAGAVLGQPAADVWTAPPFALDRPVAVPPAYSGDPMRLVIGQSPGVPQPPPAGAFARGGPAPAGRHLAQPPAPAAGGELIHHVPGKGVVREVPMRGPIPEGPGPAPPWQVGYQGPGELPPPEPVPPGDMYPPPPPPPEGAFSPPGEMDAPPAGMFPPAPPAPHGLFPPPARREIPPLPADMDAFRDGLLADAGCAPGAGGGGLDWSLYERTDAGWGDNFSLYTGGAYAHTPLDLGVNSGFGVRSALNWGVPLHRRLGLGAQLGAAVDQLNGVSALGQDLLGATDQTQGFFTGGLFMRNYRGLTLGAAYDVLTSRYYTGVDVGQWRAQASYQFLRSDEVGWIGTFRDFGDSVTVGGAAHALQAIQQHRFFWRHSWDDGSALRLWAGLAEGHGAVVLTGEPYPPPVHTPFLFGADVFFPLGDYLAVYGEANFITPNDTGTVTATCGLALFPGGWARQAARGRFAPLLPVAGNTTLPVDVR